MQCVADPLNDADADGVCGDVDNCPITANVDQLDTDADGLGDVLRHLCYRPAERRQTRMVSAVTSIIVPSSANLDQLDTGMLTGWATPATACAADPLNDADADGVCGDVDNCPEHCEPRPAGRRCRWTG